MPKKKTLETPSEEKLVEFEVVIYKEGEEPKEVSERPSEVIKTKIITASAALGLKDPLADILNKLRDAVGDIATISSISRTEVGDTKFIVVKLSKGSYEKTAPVIDQFTKTTEQANYSGAHPDTIAIISNAVSKLTTDPVVIDYE